ncbi:MAG: protein-disulfide reductase DsbD domain-containing protein [Actinomycetota bacterium]
MLRPSAEQLLRAALGEQLELPPVERVDGEVAVDVAFDGEMWWPGVVHDLVVRFAVPSGQHLYGEPVPDGMVATTVEVDDQVSLVVQPARLPPTSPHTLGTGETLQIFDGDVTVRVPMTHLGRALVPADDGRTVVRLTGTVRWQSCDDEACHLPRNESFSIEVPAAKHDSPASELEHPEGMDVRVRLGEMVSRRTDRPLGDIMREATAD